MTKRRGDLRISANDLNALGGGLLGAFWRDSRAPSVSFFMPERCQHAEIIKRGTDEPERLRALIPGASQVTLNKRLAQIETV